MVKLYKYVCIPILPVVWILLSGYTIICFLSDGSGDNRSQVDEWMGSDNWTDTWWNSVDSSNTVVCLMNCEVDGRIGGRSQWKENLHQELYHLCSHNWNAWKHRAQLHALLHDFPSSSMWICAACRCACACMECSIVFDVSAMPIWNFKKLKKVLHWRPAHLPTETSNPPEWKQCIANENGAGQTNFFGKKVTVWILTIKRMLIFVNKMKNNYFLSSWSYL